MISAASTMRVFEPYPGVYAYYDGRVEGRRLCQTSPNWLDDSAYGLGISSYAVVDSGYAIVYDTHITLEHARSIRAHLTSIGVKSMRVVLSHWHIDHIAGNEAFADCDIMALKITAEILEENREEIARSIPSVSPLITPNWLFEGSAKFQVGSRSVELHHFNIHSVDGNVLWLPDERILLAGDTLEDTVTYIAEADNIATHVEELSRMLSWPICGILPNHGHPERIAGGGYDQSLIVANLSYLKKLREYQNHSLGFPAASLKEFIERDSDSVGVSYFAAYEDVHKENIASIKRALKPV